MSEVWKDIPGYEGLYQVSDYGNIVSLNYRRTKGMKKAMTPSHDEKGYRIVILFKNGKRRTVKVHRIVAGVFIPNPNALPEVNHIDGNKENNRVENLEWTDRKGNMGHANRTGALDNAKQELRKWSKTTWQIPVIATDVRTGQEHEFSSIAEAGRSLNVCASKITACLKRRRRTTGGFTFRKAGDK